MSETINFRVRPEECDSRHVTRNVTILRHYSSVALNKATLPDRVSLGVAE